MAGSYVWGFWWVARQVEHLGNPWFTRYIAAPAGAQLGLHALMPLPGVLMMPVTVAFGPSTSYNLLSIAMPGLLSYAMYRVGRLWLTSQTGRDRGWRVLRPVLDADLALWYHLNLATGVLFLPLALEAAIRLIRRQAGGGRWFLVWSVGAGPAVRPGDGLCWWSILTGLALLSWLLRRPMKAKLRLGGAGRAGLRSGRQPAAHRDRTTAIGRGCHLPIGFPRRLLRPRCPVS